LKRSRLHRFFSAVHFLVRDFIFAFTHGTTADACT